MKIKKVLFVIVLVLSITACGNQEKMSTQTDARSELSTTYSTDTELGQGAKTITVEVKTPEQIVTFTIHTDADTVGEALLENGLISGEEAEYGLYIKSVNGMVADYDIDQSYWAFYINDEYAMAGVDGTEITEGEVYQLVYTK